ncbi:Alpha/beta hydrolase fold-1 [Xylogone sp. PMI_703]|nr:Alpha/beta hydrolase fold-1 [Xylogone sp. PMI_703]
MPETKPTIILVPGAWHTPNGYDPILPFLHASGFKSTSVHLPSIGVSPGLPNFLGDVEAIRKVALGLIELGKEVVIVSHSYGGVPTSEAVRGLGKKDRQAQGLPGGVILLIYIAAIVPEVGSNALEALKDEIKPIPQERIDNGDGTISMVNPIECFYNDLDKEEAKFWSSLLRTQSSGVFTSPLTYDGYRHIASMYIFTTRDQALSIQTQRQMAANAGITLTEDIDTGHSPFLSRPRETAEIIQRVIGRIAGEHS